MFDSCEKLHKTSKQKLFYWLCLFWARQNYIMQNKKKCFCFTALSVTLHWNKNKMFLFHSVFSDFAVKQKQNVFVSLHLFFGPVGIPYTTTSTHHSLFSLRFFVLFVFLSPHEKHSRKWCAGKKIKKKQNSCTKLTLCVWQLPRCTNIKTPITRLKACLYLGVPSSIVNLWIFYVQTNVLSYI